MTDKIDIANKIKHLVEQTYNTSEFSPVFLTNASMLEAVRNTPFGVDFRVREKEEENFGSVFDGVRFDSKKVTSQAYVIKDENQNDLVAISTVVVAPKSWIKNRRYFLRVKDGVKICDFAMLKGSIPNFFIIPAWTYVRPEYRGRFKIMTTLKNVVNLLEEEAPVDTYIEINVMGLWPYIRHKELYALLEKDRGSVIPVAELPFSLEQIDLNNPESIGSVQLVHKLYLQQLVGVGGSESLGPVFVRKVR